MSGATANVLEAVVAAARRRVEDARGRSSLEELKRLATPRDPARSFRRALERPDGINIIAECKRRSPAKGILRVNYDPVAIARGYETAGAAAISVLTEPTFFDGAPEHLTAVRAAVSLPVLRKDFIVDPYQVWEARAAGADAVLLIVAALDDAALLELLGEAREASLDVLVEVHDEEELGRALAAGADIVGVNNRNLRTLAVDLETSRRLASLFPSGVVAVAESGLRNADDVRELHARGYRGFLVGERFMTAEDPGAALAALRAAIEGTQETRQGGLTSSVGGRGEG
ncbi:MAG TPA: indole-3-glycerol phosphate synthase TrpC [Vicinamibacterales bacterium]|nr:indole-3-glycerol phosphate synthase TrpC [Vicinamibacterales bacterium]